MARDPEPEPDPGAEHEPSSRELPPRMIAIAYALAAVCLVAPLAILGAGFAGGVLLNRGRQRAGVGVIVAAVACTAAGIALR